jgi:4a-hydroxytetrahydrobiopterin dehydratase
MSKLSQQRCKPCDGGIAPHSIETASALLKQLHADWKLDPDGKSIRRAFKFKNFYRTMSFVNAVAHIANVEGHHPDLEIGYDYCRMKFTTHAIGGLSDNDFICAAKVDDLPLG